jgi:hypothetical protein
LGRGYFQRREIEQLISDHQAGRADHSARLWLLLQLEVWHSEVVEVPHAPRDAAAARTLAS